MTGSTAAPRHPELEALISADPDDVRTWLVYAHWLSTQGDPLGDAITANASLQGEIGSTRKSRANKGRIGALVRVRIETQARLEEELRKVAQGTYRGAAALRCTWRTGLVSELVASVDLDRQAAAAPLAALVSHPYCRFLEGVKLDMRAPRDVATPSDAPVLAWVLDAVSVAACSTTVRLVSITAQDAIASVDGSQLADALPRLKSLTLAARDVELHGSFRALEKLVLYGQRIACSGEFPSVRALTLLPLAGARGSWRKAAFPALQELTLDARPIQLTTTEQLSLHGPFPEAAELTIQDASDRLLEEFFAAPFPRVQRLRLPGMSGRGQVLTRHVDRLRQLQELDLRANGRRPLGLPTGLKDALGSRLLVDRY